MEETHFVDLSDDEVRMLVFGVTNWAGPNFLTDEIAKIIGFKDGADLIFHDGQDLRYALEAREPLSAPNWLRVLRATEISFADSEYGGGWEWSVVSNLTDAQSIKLLRSIQRKLFGIVRPLRPLPTPRPYGWDVVARPAGMTIDRLAELWWERERLIVARDYETPSRSEDDMRWLHAWVADAQQQKPARYELVEQVSKRWDEPLNRDAPTDHIVHLAFVPWRADEEPDLVGELEARSVQPRIIAELLVWVESWRARLEARDEPPRVQN